MLARQGRKTLVAAAGCPRPEWVARIGSVLPGKTGAGRLPRAGRVWMQVFGSNRDKHIGYANNRGGQPTVLDFRHDKTHYRA